jgi:hypothetical protein
MRHRGCAPLFQWASSTFPREDFSATLASTSVCFDVSVFELFYPLSVGGTLILVDSALHVLDLDPGSPVTSIITVPSALGAMVDLARFPASVRALYLAGEPLRRSLVDRIYKQTGVDRIYNIYGPTENTVYSTWSSVRREDTGEPTIGRPLPGCRAYVLDDTQQPVPVLHVGELVLGGAGVARGYRGRPELTSERFVPDPFAAEPGARMYRTGDLARFRPDGEIELLGRRDSQIKLHGYRIELGEIEAALSQHPDVLEAAVRAQEHRGGRRLVGYLSPRPAFQGGPEALSAAARAHLERVLPPYMIPPILIVLPDLPRTLNGKLDRSRLPDWEEEPTVDHATTLYPRSPTAAAITGVWAELLHCPATKIGMFDSFFSLGGHSLLLAQMAQMLSVRCNRRLTIADLFRLRDVASIAAWLDAPPDERSAIQAAEERAQQRRKHLASRVRSNQAGTGNC